MEEKIIKEYNKCGKPKKTNKLYYLIIKSNKNEPEMVNNLLKRINEWGYYKDYFYMLEINENKIQDEDFKNKVYDVVVRKLKEQIAKYKRGEKLDTFAKWLPSENKRFDKNLNCVDEITKRYYGNYGKIKRKIMYRKLLGKLRSKIPIIEREIKCEYKEYDKYSKKSLENNINRLIRENEEEKIKEYYRTKCQNMDIENIIKIMRDDKMYKIRENAINEIYEKNKKEIIKKSEVKYKNMIDNNVNLLVILDSNIMKNNLINKIIEIIIIFDRKNNKILINKKNPKEQKICGKKLTEIRDKITREIYDHKKIEYKKIKEKDKKIIIVGDETSYNELVYSQTCEKELKNDEIKKILLNKEKVINIKEVKKENLKNIINTTSNSINYIKKIKKIIVIIILIIFLTIILILTRLII